MLKDIVTFSVFKSSFIISNVNALHFSVAYLIWEQTDKSVSTKKSPSSSPLTASIFRLAVSVKN